MWKDDAEHHVQGLKEHEVPSEAQPQATKEPAACELCCRWG